MAWRQQNATALVHPSLNPALPRRPGIGQTKAMPQRFVDVLVPVALDQTYSYRVPDGSPEGGRCRLGAARPAQGHGRGLGRKCHAGAASAQPPQGCGDKLDVPPLRRNCAASSIGSRITRCRRAAWCCGWRCGWASISDRSACARRAACRPSPPQRMTPARHRVTQLLSDGLLRAKSEVARRRASAPA
jgi:primosomal protein N' (replication factor Y)